MAKAIRFGSSNKKCNIALMSNKTIINALCNQQHQHISAEQQQKALAVGQSKYNLSQQLKQWLQPAIISDDVEPTPHQTSSPNNSTNKISHDDSEGVSEDILRQPFLDGGQGRTIDFLGVITQPQGDVNVDGGTIKLSPAPHNRVGWQCPERANSNNLHPYDVKTDQGQHISTHVQHVKGSTMMNKSQGASNHLAGLLPPVLEAMGSLVAGKDIKKLRLQNKWQQHALQKQQPMLLVWTTHQGDTVLPPSTPLPERWQGEMCPSGIATSHPAGELLKEWALVGCPAQTGRPWTKLEIWEAVERGPHRLALSEEVLEHFVAESAKKVNAGQARIVEWDSIKVRR